MTSAASGIAARMMARSSRSRGCAAADWAAMYSSTVANVGIFDVSPAKHRLGSLTRVLDTFRLDGKVALVTGGSRGLGLQIAEALGEAGAAIAITARREEGLLKGVEYLTQRGINAMSAVCDISKNDQ